MTMGQLLPSVNTQSLTTSARAREKPTKLFKIQTLRADPFTKEPLKSWKPQ
jgi:hypothetical protein